MSDLGRRLDELLQEEQDLQLTSFSNATAIEVGQRLLQIGIAGNLPITIDVCRNEQQLFHAALPGTSRDNDEWIKRKNRVVNHFGHSSLYMGLRYKLQGTTIEAKSLLPEALYAPHGGAFPVMIRGVGVV